MSLTSEETTERADIMTDLSTYVKEQEVLFINGQRDLSTFDAYMNEVMNMGFAKAQQITQDAYDLYVENTNP